MGKFVNGLLTESSVNKMAEAMQVAPRKDPREVVDKPTGAAETSNQLAPGAPAPTQNPQAGQQQNLQADAETNIVRKNLPPPEQKVLSDTPEDAPTDTGENTALPQPTAEEEKQARILMANVVDFLYGEGLQQTTKTLKQKDQPVPEAIGQIASQLVTTQLDAAEVANQTVSPNILMAVGAEVVSQIYELAESLGVWQPGTEERASKDMNLSLNYATNLFVQTQQSTGRQDRIAGMQDVAKAAQIGEYESQPGSQFTNDMAPVPEGGLL